MEKIEISEKESKILGVIEQLINSAVEKGIEKGIEKLKNKEILEKGDVVVLSGGAKTFSSGMTKKVIGGILRID